MEVRLNTYNNSYTAPNCCKPKPQSFTGLNISKGYDTFCNKVGEKVCRPLFDNRFIDGIAKKIKGKDNAIKFFLIGGSAITSGVYMYRTLTNDKMDKDRKKTLAVNQFLTFLVSTLGALLIDSRMKEWWDAKKDQFFDLNVPNAADIRNKMAEHNEKIKLKNANLLENEKEPLLKLGDYLEKYGRKHFFTQADYEKVLTKYNGFGALRSIIVFAMVYRFLVPVAVTKPANILCDKYLAHKKAKDAQKAQQAQLKTQAQNVQTAA